MAISQITSNSIAAGAVSASDLADGSITTVKIADSNITTAKIADLNITTGKLANSAVGATQILIGSGGVFEYGSNSYGNYTKFADGTMVQNGLDTISHTSTLAYKMVTFPVAFYGSVTSASTPYGFSGTQVLSHGDTNAGTEVYGRQENNGGNTTTTSSIYLGCRTFLSSTYPTVIAWQAIGRWKA